MGILFLVALVLAWPTAGLSIVAYIIVLIIRSVMRGKARMHYANQNAAQRAIAKGAGRVPSWTCDRNKIEEFVLVIQNLAMRRGVPQLFLSGILIKDEIFTHIVHYAGAMEQQGASFNEQKMAVSDLLVGYWNDGRP